MSSQSGQSAPALGYSLTSVDEKTECYLFDFVPERSNPSRYQAESSLNLIALGHGPARLDTDRETPNPLVFRNSYRLNNLVDLAEMESFFQTMQGLNKSFCLPSWQADVTLASDAVLGTDTIQVEEHEVSLYVGQRMFFYLAGQYLEAIVASWTDTTITFDAGIGIALPAGTSGSIIYRVTFASDSITYSHQTSTLLDVNISFVEEIREADQIGEDPGYVIELTALCYTTLSETQYLALEDTDYALLTTDCESLDEAAGVTLVSGEAEE